MADESHDLLNTSWPDTDDWEPERVENFTDDLIGAILCFGVEPLDEDAMPMNKLDPKQVAEARLLKFMRDHTEIAPQQDRWNRELLKQIFLDIAYLKGVAQQALDKVAREEHDSA